MKKKILLLLLIAGSILNTIHAQTCSGKLSLFTASINKSQNFLNSEVLSSTDLLNYTAEVNDYYLNDTKNKFFVLQNVTTSIQNNIMLRYTPRFDATSVKLQLSFEIIDANDVTMSTGIQPSFVDATGQSLTVTELSSGVDYYIKIPVINPAFKIVLLEKLKSYACISETGMTMTVDIAEKQTDNTFQTVCGTTGLVSGIQTSKLITKFRQTAINNVIHTDLTKGEYCFLPGQNSQEFSYTYSFVHPEKDTRLTNFVVYFYPYHQNAGQDISMIEWGNNFTINLLTLNDDGTTTTVDVKQLATAKLLDNALVSCPAQTATAFLQDLSLSLPSFTSKQKLVFTFKENICCPKLFGLNKERGWSFQYQHNNECGKWFASSDAGILPSAVPYVTGATNFTLSATISPSSITAKRFPVNKLVGLGNYTATVGLGTNAALLLSRYQDFDVENYSVVAVLRYENGLRYTQYDANNLPINGTQLDYLAWNNSLQGSINPFYPYSDFIFKDKSNQVIPGTKLVSGNNWHDYFTQNSTFPNTFVFQYDNDVFNDPALLANKYLATIAITNKLENATFNWSFEPDCPGMPVDHLPAYQLEFYLIPNDRTCNTCAIPLDRVVKSVEVDCPGCKFTGGDVYVTSNQRVTLGEVDANNDGKADFATPTPINPALNQDSDPSNDYNLNTAMVGDIVQLHHIYYLTEGQGFHYTDANGVGKIASMNDAMFGTDALTHSYLEVAIPKGDSIQLYEDATYQAEVRLLDNSGNVIKIVSNIDLIDESTNTFRDWIISHNTTNGLTKYIFDLSIDKLKGSGTIPVSAFHSGYALDLRFYVRIANNIVGGVDGRGVVNNLISFRPYFSKVDYNSRDTRYLDGEFSQITGFDVNGDPYYEVNGTKYTWTGFNSANRLVTDYNSNIAMNSHKLLICGGGQTTLNTVAVYLGTYFADTSTMWNTYTSPPGCINSVRYVGQIDVGKNTSQIFPREYRQSPNGSKFFFSIPAGNTLSSIRVGFGPYGGGSDNNYVNQNYSATALNIAGDVNFAHVTLVRQNADYIHYSMDLNALVYRSTVILGNPIVPFYRGDEREELTVYVNYETQCTNNAMAVPGKNILAVGAANEPYWARLQLNQPAAYINSTKLAVSTAHSNPVLTAPVPISLTRTNTTASVDDAGTINYQLSLSNTNSQSSIPNAFIVVQYDRAILSTVELFNTNNQSVQSFDVLVNNTIYNRYFYNLNPSNTNANIISPNSIKDYTLKATFESCPDNNFRIYIGYGYSCNSPVSASTDFSSLCNYTAPSQANSVIIFVNSAQLTLVNAGYVNNVCGMLNYDYSIKSNSGIAKDIQSTITLPVGITIPDLTNITVKYGAQTLSASEYTLIQNTSNHQEYNLTIHNQADPFYNTSLRLYPTGEDLINITIGMQYSQSCNQNFENSAIRMTATGNSICGSAASTQSDFAIGSLLACANSNTLTGYISRTDGSATFICKDAIGTPISTALKVTPSNAALTYSYEWWYSQSNSQYVKIAGATSNTYSTNQTGWYKAVFTDVATGCFGQAITQVIDNIPPPVDPLVCVGENPPLILNGLNGVSGSYAASWYTDSAPDVLVFNISQPGYYYAMAIVPGCTLRTAAPVHVQFKDSPQPYTFAGNSVYYHLNNDVHIEVANSAVNDLSLHSINWSQDAFKHDLAPFTVNKDGKYTVTVTNNTTQCSISSTAVVASPKIKLVQYGNYCQNTNGIILRAEANFAAGNYSWYKVNTVNPLSTTFISNGRDCFIPAPGGLYMVSNDLDQTCSGSIFYINLNNGINDPANASFVPSDLVTVTGLNDGDFETIDVCTDARDFQSTFICQDQIPDFNTPGYEQDLIGHYIITDKAAQWNSPGGNNLWNGSALSNPNSTVPSLQQQFLIVDGEVGNGNQTIWTKTIDISQYPSLLQSFFFKASIRDIAAGASLSKREIPEVSVNISFLTASGVSVEAASVEPVQVLYNSNNTQWIDLTAIVDRFNYYQGCEDQVISEDFTQAKIEIILSGGGAIGRDLGVDEIVFIPAKLCGGTSSNAAINMSNYRLARTCNASLVKLMDNELHTCYGVPVTFTLNAFTDEQLLTEWFDNGSYSGVPVSTALTLTVSPKTNKQYYLRVTDPVNNCSYTDQVTVYVTQPEIHIASNADNACTQSDITFNVDNFTILGNIQYKWYKNGMALTQGFNSRTVTLSGIQNADVITCELVNQCKNADESPLVLFSNEIAVKGKVSTADAGADVTICSGESVTIGTASITGNTYSWNPAATLSNAAVATPLASPTATTVYGLQVTDVNGCISSNDVTVTIEGAIPEVHAGADKNICPGAATVSGASVTGGTTYTWTPSTGVSDVHVLTPQFSPAITTDYILEAEDAFGCTASDEMRVAVLPAPQVSVSLSGNTITSQVSGGQPPYQYSWFKDAVSISGVTSATYAATTSGLYDLHVTDQNTCEGSADVQVVVSAVISGNNMNGLINIYPIPALSTVHIDYADDVLHIQQLKLFDVTGREVMNVVLNNQNSYLLNVSDLASGLYLVKLYCADGNEIISKILVER